MMYTKRAPDNACWRTSVHKVTRKSRSPEAEGLESYFFQRADRKEESQDGEAVIMQAPSASRGSRKNSGAKYVNGRK